MMESGGDVSADSGELGDSFLGATGPYVVEGGDGDELENVEDNDDEEDIITDKPLREQDRFLPIANVARIMKKSIPKMGKIARDAKECVQECVSEFVSFITSEASERCHQEKRKTINGEDLLFAMSTLGFDNYVEPLKLFLQKYRESLKGEKVLNPNDPDNVLQGLTEEAFSSLPANLLATDQAGQQSVVYTTAYPQIAQLSNFG